MIRKRSVGLIVVTPGHTLTGEVHINMEAVLSGFIESTRPIWVPMTDVRTRSLADRRVIARYAFALLNRSQIVAATELQPGMVRVATSCRAIARRAPAPRFGPPRAAGGRMSAQIVDSWRLAEPRFRPSRAASADAAPPERKNPGWSGPGVQGDAVVAGGGFEPPTFGL